MFCSLTSDCWIVSLDDPRQVSMAEPLSVHLCHQSCSFFIIIRMMMMMMMMMMMISSYYHHLHHYYGIIITITAAAATTTTRRTVTIIIQLQGAIRDFFFFFFFLQSRQSSENCLQHLHSSGPARSCANHVQHVERLSRGTCRVPLGTKGQLSY